MSSLNPAGGRKVVYGTIITREEIILRELGRILYDEMEHLDPRSGAWENLGKEQQEFFVLAAEITLSRGARLIKEYYGIGLPTTT